MIKTLKRIEPLQLGKMAAAFYALMSLIFVPFFFIFAIAGLFIPKGDGGMAASAGIIVMSLVFIVLMPVLYGVMGFIIGIIGAWIYNFVAKWIGGIQVEVE